MLLQCVLLSMICIHSLCYPHFTFPLVTQKVAEMKICTFLCIVLINFYLPNDSSTNFQSLKQIEFINSVTERKQKSMVVDE